MRPTFAGQPKGRIRASGASDGQVMGRNGASFLPFSSASAALAGDLQITRPLEHTPLTRLWAWAREGPEAADPGFRCPLQGGFRRGDAHYGAVVNRPMPKNGRSGRSRCPLAAPFRGRPGTPMAACLLAEMPHPHPDTCDVLASRSSSATMRGPSRALARLIGIPP